MVHNYIIIDLRLNVDQLAESSPRKKAIFRQPVGEKGVYFLFFTLRVRVIVELRLDTDHINYVSILHNTESQSRVSGVGGFHGNKRESVVPEYGDKMHKQQVNKQYKSHTHTHTQTRTHTHTHTHKTTHSPPTHTHYTHRLYLPGHGSCEDSTVWVVTIASVRHDAIEDQSLVSAQGYACAVV
jgi:hypothetical protein